MKFLRRAGFTLALVLTSVSVFAADSGAIHGTVKDPLGAVVAQAQLDLFLQGKKIASTTTDQEGRYQFSGLASGRYRVHAAAASFTAQESDSIYLSNGSSVSLDVNLKIGVVSQQIVVSATGTSIPETQVGASISVITADQFQNRQDILEPLQQVPGAQVLQSGQRGAATSLFLRGGNSTANKVLVDGIPLNDFGGVANFGIVTTTGIDQLEVLRGPNSVLYGPDAMAGVVSLTTRRGTTPLPELSYSFDAGNFNTRRHDGSLGGVFRRLDYLTEYSRFDTNNSQPNSTFHNGTYVVNLGLALNSTTDVRFTGRYTTTALGQPNAIDLFGIPDDSFQRDQDAYLGVTLQNQTTSRWHNLLRYGATRLRLQDVNPSPSGIPFDNGFGFGLNFLGLPLTIKGANGFSATGAAILDFGGVYPTGSSSSSKRDSVYLQSDYSFNSHLTGLVAVRYEKERGYTLSFSKTAANRDNESYIAELHGSLGRAYATVGGSVEKNAVFGVTAIPRVSLAYYLFRPSSSGAWNGTKLKFNYGQGIRAPSIFEATSSLASQFAPGDPIIAQLHLGPIAAERSRSFDAGFEQLAWNGRAKLSATFFHNRFANQVEFVPPSALEFLGVPPSVASQTFGATLNSGNTRALGVETELEVALGHGFKAHGTYTYLDSVLEHSFTSDAFSCSQPSQQFLCAFNPAFPTIPIGAFSPLVGNRPFRRAPHSGSFSLDYSRRKLNLGISGYMVSRRDDSTFLSDGFFGNTLLLPNRNLAAGYQKIDFSGSYRINRHLAFFSVVENLGSQHYDPAFGFRAPPLNFHTGFRITLGGESWK